MKRQDLIRHLQTQGCELLREGRSHSIWHHPASGQQSAVPRHRGISDYTPKAFVGS